MADALSLVSLGWTVACCRFHTWGEALPSRPVQDIAFAVARFFERGGSFQNYYMVNHDLHWWEANPNRNTKFRLDISRLQRGVEAWGYLGWSWTASSTGEYGWQTLEVKSSCLMICAVPRRHKLWENIWWGYYYKLWLWCPPWWIWYVACGCVSSLSLSYITPPRKNKKYSPKRVAHES